MPAEDQSATLAFLQEEAARLGPVGRHSTHISEVFVAGDTAFKLKRAVRLPYLDFSTPAIRLAMCARELALNSRTAPALYRRVRRITRAPGGGLAFDGPGALVDAVLEMARFDQAAGLDQVAAAGGLAPACLDALCDEIVALHRAAARVPTPRGAAGLAGLIAANMALCEAAGLFAPGETRALRAGFEARLARFAGLLDRRAAAGWERRGHGDLHLGNIALFHGKPVLFDCLEFSEALAEIDVLYDLAFLLMDLWARGAPGAANRVLNRYLDAMGGEAALPALPLMMALRAIIRAHIAARRAATGPKGADTETATAPAKAQATARAEARGYFDLARHLLAPVPGPARVIALGGFSGSGKSTLALALAPDLFPPPGARIIESDRTRKAMFGTAPEARLPQPAYAEPVSERVYSQMARRTGALAASGVPVVACALFADEPRRQQIAAAAQKAGAAFSGHWLRVPDETLRTRITSRPPSASDAGLAVLNAQLARAQLASAPQKPGPNSWPALAAGRGVAQTLAALRKAAGLPAR